MVGAIGRLVINIGGNFRVTYVNSGRFLFVMLSITACATKKSLEKSNALLVVASSFACTSSDIYP